MKTTDANLKRHIRLLLDNWFDLPEVSARPDEIDLDAFLNSVGFLNATAECTRTFLDALPENRIAKGILARSIFEMGTTCVWLALRGEAGFEAMRFEDQRHHKALARELQGKVSSEELKLSVERVDTEALHPKNHLAEEARRFEARVDSLNAGNTPLYAIYRMYSQYSHGSLGVSNSYVDEDGSGAIGLCFPAKHPALNDHLGTAVAPLVWAMNAVNKLLNGQPLAAKLTTVQVLLGTGIDFSLKEP